VDKEASTVRLIDPILREYLRTLPNLFGRGLLRIAETRLTHPNPQLIKDIPARLLRSPKRISTLGGRANVWLSNRVESLALELLDHHNNHISAKLISGAIAPRDIIWDATFSVLHCVSSFGTVRVALALAGFKRRVSMKEMTQV